MLFINIENIYTYVSCRTKRDKLMEEEFELWLEVRLTEGFFC